MIVKEIYCSIRNEVSIADTEKTPTIMDILLGGDNIDDTQDEFEKHILEPQINHNFDANVWWKEHEKTYPILGRLTKKYLAIPATSSSERVLFNAIIL